ncbi:MAG: glycoside hydrolase family 15 protein, partial [Candidatus Entotheonellia bacterium]
LADWRRERETIFESLLREGFDAGVGAFVQAYGSTALDASILRLPLLGVIETTNPRMRSTIEQIERRLMRNGLVYRYLDVDDGIAGGEGTFAICTFWLIQNYVMLGRLTEAEELFRHVLSFANDLGLFSEEIDPGTGEQLGNFPQAFTHIALINAAVRLAAARQGKKPAEHTILEEAGVPLGRKAE